MATLQELSARLESLRELRSRGTRSVTFSDGRNVTYRTDEEIVAAIADLERQIAAATSTPLREIRLTTSKGL